MCNISFLRPNFTDDYNNDMDHVDMIDHLEKTYQMGRCLLQRKWWWSIFMWAFDRILLNSYVLYKSWYVMHDLKPMTHYAFRESFCLSWLDSEQHWPLRYSKGTRGTIQSTVAQVSTSISSVASTLTHATLEPTKLISRSTRLNDARVNNKKFNMNRLTVTPHYNHLPEPCPKQTEFQLHKWCLKEHADTKTGRVKKQLCYCCTCNITLCMKCYSIFHKVHDLSTIKFNLINSSCAEYDNLNNFT